MECGMCVIKVSSEVNILKCTFLTYWHISNDWRSRSLHIPLEGSSLQICTGRPSFILTLTHAATGSRTKSNGSIYRNNRGEKVHQTTRAHKQEQTHGPHARIKPNYRQLGNENRAFLPLNPTLKTVTPLQIAENSLRGHEQTSVPLYSREFKS